ncbi:hypothetical protein HY484_01820 [Candidatus Woesearchaeota archaeon]|nr:hypothetical protein [Candidatus Woesearchaeota archaeon]
MQKTLWSFVVMLFLLVSVVQALPVGIDAVKVNDVSLSPNTLNRLDVERGDTIDIEVVLTGTDSSKNVEVEAFISGFEFNDIERVSDHTGLFDVFPNVTYVKRLSIPLPDTLDKDDYKLRIIVSDRNNDEVVQNYNLKIDVPRHLVRVKDVILTPENEITAGGALLVSVRVENLGANDEEDVKVKVAVPALGVSATKYIDEVDSDDDSETEEVYLRLPECASAGVYDVVATVYYAEGHRTMTGSGKINVLKNELCDSEGVVLTQPSKVLINIGSSFETVEPGSTAVFPITVTNNGRLSRSFSVVPSAGDWASLKVSPTSTVVLGAGKTHTTYIFVTPDVAVADGAQVVTASISSSGEVFEQVALTVNVDSPEEKSSTSFTLKRLLEIGLVVLLVLLIIVGVIVGFSMLRDDEEPPQQQHAEPYY